MKFHKRPVDNHEIALAMAVTTCSANCNCSVFGPCGCPPIPTHQIQYDQSSEDQTTASLQAPAEEVIRITT